MNQWTDDHYIPDQHNAHIDTSEFQTELARLAKGQVGAELDFANLEPHIVDLVLGRLSNELEQPSDDALICRYLSITKFLWFIQDFSVYLGSARAFEDPTDCSIPTDYNNCVQDFFMERGVAPIVWDDFAERFRAQWLVSSWTEVADHHDDYLLWHRYAGGVFGVGITVRYRDICELLKHESKQKTLTHFSYGKVSYGSPLRIPPFTKRRIFRNEREVRFACRGEALAAVQMSLLPIRDRIGLRFSPDAPLHHVDAIRQTWMKRGGSDRYQIAGD